ncbi:hypothetical protein ACS8FD_10830 [Psychrobacter sp. 1U2]|uniref:hypothetical protein n=1 Tax=Psychrobacter sp. 1U2 TaxID=3453577 RepID=UPI003F46A193
MALTVLIGYNLCRYFALGTAVICARDIKLAKIKSKLFFIKNFIILYISSRPYAITLCLNLAPQQHKSNLKSI